MVYISYITLEKHKKRANTQRHSNSSLVKGFKIFLTDGSCGLPLEAGHLDDLWFATTRL
jgi:hypothetical protein